MTPSNTIEELVGRVEAATGPDRELDAMIAAAFRVHWTPPEHWINRSSEIEFRPMRDVGWRAGWLEIWMPGETAARDKWKAAEYTSSIDAALALKERVLPGWTVNLKRYPDGSGFASILRYDNHKLTFFDSLETDGPRHRLKLPLAIILATLRSRIKGDHNDEA